MFLKLNRSTTVREGYFAGDIDFDWWLQPGLTGGSEDSYVRHMLLRARSKGWRVVVFNSRGCGDSPVTTPQVLLLFFQVTVYTICIGISEMVW